MNKDWKEFLLTNGAEPDDSGIIQFDDAGVSNKKAATGNNICDLSHFSTLVIAGDDAQPFMQGQFTNDVNQVDANQQSAQRFL